MTEPKMIDVNYNGKVVARPEIAPGVVKYGDAYLLQCAETKDWKYCNQPRFDKLVTKMGSIENVGVEHCSREGKAIRKVRAEEAAAKVAADAAAEKAEVKPEPTETTELEMP